MRMLLCRPASRVRILLLKYAACVIYTFALTAFIGITALLAGILYKGAGGLFVFAPLEKIFVLYPTGEGLWRFGLSLVFLSLAQLSITSVAFMLSCCNMKPAAATVITLSVFFLDSIFRNIPYFESLAPWFITTHMAAWLQMFQSFIPWTVMAQDYLYLFALDATFVVIGLLVFDRRDLKG